MLPDLMHPDLRRAHSFRISGVYSLSEENPNLSETKAKVQAFQNSLTELRSFLDCKKASIIISNSVAPCLGLYAHKTEMNIRQADSSFRNGPPKSTCQGFSDLAAGYAANMATCRTTCVTPPMSIEFRVQLVNSVAPRETRLSWMALPKKQNCVAPGIWNKFPFLKGWRHSRPDIWQTRDSELTRFLLFARQHFRGLCSLGFEKRFQCGLFSSCAEECRTVWTASLCVLWRVC